MSIGTIETELLASVTSNRKIDLLINNNNQKSSDREH